MFFKTRKKKGVTLIEVLTSIAILALLIIPIANLVIHSSGTAKSAQTKQKGSLAGQSILEQLGNIDDSVVHNNGKYDFTYTGIDGTSQSATIDFNSEEWQQINVSGKNKISVQVSKQIENKSATELGAIPHTGDAEGDNFKNNYSNNSALALDIAKTSDDKLATIYNANSSEYYTLSDNQKYMIYIDNSGRCSIYGLTYNLQDIVNAIPTDATFLADIGQIDYSKGNKVRILISGNGKDGLIVKGNIGKTDYPFDLNLYMGVLSNYSNDLEVVVTKGNNVNGIIDFQTRVSSATQLNKTEYQSSTDVNSKMGDLYKVSVKIEDNKNQIFTGSTTCNFRKN